MALCWVIPKKSLYNEVLPKELTEEKIYKDICGAIRWKDNFLSRYELFHLAGSKTSIRGSINDKLPRTWEKTEQYFFWMKMYILYFDRWGIRRNKEDTERIINLMTRITELPRMVFICLVVEWDIKELSEEINAMF